MPGTCSPRRARPARRRPRRAPRRRPLGRAPRRPRPRPGLPPRRRRRPRRRPRRCRPRAPPPGRRRPPPPCRPPPRPRRGRAAPRPRSPRASHPTPPARRTPTAARRAAARRVGGRSAGRALPRRVAPAGEAVEPYPGHRRDWLPARALGRERLLPHHWQSGPPIGYASPMAEEVGERRSGGRQGALLAQYLRIKAEHRRAILLFRLGDFYEMFFEDAETASRDLDLTLTARNRGDPDEVPLCGFPAHAAQPYITRLLARGHTVAVCEQAPARGRGLMEREVVRVITPGTILEEESLAPGAPSVLAALAAEGDRFGIAAIDFATGAFRASEVRGWELARDELERLAPRELLLAPDLPPPVDAACREGRPWAAAVLPEPVPLEGDLPRLAARAAGGALAYVDAAYRRRPAHLRPPEVYAPAGFLQLDAATRRNLELLQTLGGERRGTLLWVLDRPDTPMGARREGLARALRGIGAPAHGHRLAQGPPQQGVRLLRRGDAPEPAARPARLRAPADAGRCGALRHADAARARGARARRRGAPARARGASLRGAARHGGGAPSDARAHGGRARDPGRARLARRGRAPPGLRASGHHARPDARHPRRPPSGGGGGGGRRLRAQRRAPRSRGGAAPRHHRPQHGRQVDLPPAGGADHAARADGELRPRGGGGDRARRPHLHARRRERQPGRRRVDLHGRDARDGEHPFRAHAPEPGRPRRDRARHEHLRRHLDRVGGGRAPARRSRAAADAVRDALPRADGARGREAARAEPLGRGRGVEGRDRVPAADRARPGVAQLRRRGGAPGGRAGAGGGARADAARGAGDGAGARRARARAAGGAAVAVCGGRGEDSARARRHRPGAPHAARGAGGAGAAGGDGAGMRRRCWISVLVIDSRLQAAGLGGEVRPPGGLSRRVVRSIEERRCHSATAVDAERRPDG